ncbi:MAG: signal peptidase I [Alphaproteobacteria bacterium]
MIHWSVIIYIFLLLVLCNYLLRRFRGRGFFSKKIEDKYDFTFFLAEILLLVIGFRALFLEPFIIPSSSMLPNLLVGDYIFVNKMSYGYGQYSFPLRPIDFSNRLFAKDPQRGDVVVFRYPPNTKDSYVKRIVGLPGDVLQVKNGRLYLNGEPLKKTSINDFLIDDENNLPIAQFDETILLSEKGRARDYRILERNANYGDLDNTTTYIVPDNHSFGMGDNRDNSLDSRVAALFGGVGFIPYENVIGRVAFVLFSINKHNHQSSLGWSIRFDRFFSRVK